jgi:hypothetical protein
MKKIYELDFDKEGADLVSLRREEFQLDHVDEICSAIQDFDDCLFGLVLEQDEKTMEAYSVRDSDLEGLERARKILHAIFEGNGVDIDKLTY